MRRSQRPAHSRYPHALVSLALRLFCSYTQCHREDVFCTFLLCYLRVRRTNLVTSRPSHPSLSFCALSHPLPVSTRFLTRGINCAMLFAGRPHPDTSQVTRPRARASVWTNHSAPPPNISLTLALPRKAPAASSRLAPAASQSQCTCTTAVVWPQHPFSCWALDLQRPVPLSACHPWP